MNNQQIRKELNNTQYSFKSDIPHQAIAIVIVFHRFHMAEETTNYSPDTQGIFEFYYFYTTIDYGFILPLCIHMCTYSLYVCIYE